MLKKRASWESRRYVLFRALKEKNLTWDEIRFFVLGRWPGF